MVLHSKHRQPKRFYVLETGAAGMAALVASGGKKRLQKVGLFVRDVQKVGARKSAW